jgi:hypothetical protein
LVRCIFGLSKSPSNLTERMMMDGLRDLAVWAFEYLARMSTNTRRKRVWSVGRDVWGCRALRRMRGVISCTHRPLGWASQSDVRLTFSNAAGEIVSSDKTLCTLATDAACAKHVICNGDGTPVWYYHCCRRAGHLKTVPVERM